MKDFDTRGGGGDGFWQYSWPECSKEESSRMMNPDSSSSAVAAANASVHDDMTSWLHLDDPNYSSGNLNRACSSSSVQVFQDTRLQQGFDPAADMHRQRSTSAADAALALAAGRAAGFFPQTGVEAFNRSRTVCQPLQLKSRSVSETMAPLPQPSAFGMSPGKTPVHALDNRCESKGHPGTSRKSMDYWRTQATNSVDSDRSTLDSRSVQVQQQQQQQQQQSNVGLAGAASSDKVCETSSMKQAETFTGSTGGSRSEQTEREYKRKEKDVEDTAGCHANDRRKPPRSKRSRTAEVHNLSERKRRDRINERMKALQDLIPNSNKTDKASMLDEAIEYLKMLQHQLQMMSMRSGMVSPITAIPHMPMASPYGGINMGVRLVDVSGHQSLIPSHPGLSVNVAVPGFLQGMNPDIYNMNQQIQETFVQPHIHKQEDG